MIDVFGFVVGLGVVGWFSIVIAVFLLGWLSFLFARSDRDVFYSLSFLFYASFVVLFSFGFASWLGVVFLFDMCFRGIVLYNVASDDRPAYFLLGWFVPLVWFFVGLDGDYL